MTLPPPPPPPPAPAATGSSSTGKWIAAAAAVVAVAALSSLATWQFMQKSAGKEHGNPVPQAAIDMSAAPAAPVPQASLTAPAKGGNTVPAAISPPTQAATASPPAPAPCSNCGNIESIRRVSVGKEASGAGAIIGGVAGGLLGNQIGSGSGRAAATIAGAAGGAYAGHQVEKSQRTQAYEVGIRMDDGSLRRITQSQEPEWQTGDRVRIVKGALRAPGA